tara:strand:- start:398 stop:844 length:447 start_codon:yes stop_codon:yes gene_type:complete
MQIIAANKKANYDYSIISKVEAGIVLNGSEVKSLRINTGSIKESYINEKDGELWISNCFIKTYSASSNDQNNPTRLRKLLLKKKELNKIIGIVKKEGVSIVPLCLYFNKKGFAKLTIGLAKGKKKQDKRATIKEKEWNIKKQRLLKKN